MQCKDIKEIPVLEFLMRREADDLGWAMAFPEYDSYIGIPMPGAPRKLVLAKCKQMIKKGLIDGCACGCRGDFEITEKGKDLLGEAYEI